MGAMVAVAMPYIMGGVASAVVSSAMSKGNSPNLVVEQPPAPAGANLPEGAADQQRKKASAAMGRSDTIATGPQGLGQISGENTAPKTLLGY